MGKVSNLLSGVCKFGFESIALHAARPNGLSFTFKLTFRVQIMAIGSAARTCMNER